ncbi:receptor-recognizing protein, partial [Salmonella enterica]|nr:receptor-recognizing protein [Salmonella enterica]
MAVVGVGGWIGSSAKAETGNDWMSGAMRTLGVSVPGWMSQLAGKSKEAHYSIGANHSYNKDTLVNYLRSLGSTAVVVTITGDLVSHSSAVPCLEFPSNLPNSYITLIINPGV